MPIAYRGALVVSWRHHRQTAEEAKVDKITAKTGQAPIQKVGHTAGNQYGTNEKSQVVGRSAPRDLKFK